MSMSLNDWAQSHLLVTVPTDTRVWHWTTTSHVHSVRDRIRGGGSLRDFTEQALGSGLYLSTSAIDTIDRGDEVVTAIVPAGTQVLAVDADLFGVGVAEFFEMFLERDGYAWKVTPHRGHIDRALARPPREVVPRLVDDLGVSGCVYIFGFHLSFMFRDASGLRDDPAVDVAQTVADYVATHPKESPTLAPRERVQTWLRART
jgi:hypothetical protein